MILTGIIQNLPSVVIETLWNVKARAGCRGVIAYSCSNRNIVECKGYSSTVSVCGVPRSNRNIVECKVGFNIQRTPPFFRSNRNIVECKANLQSRLSNRFTVVIETLWNVKKMDHKYQATCYG